MNTPYQSQPQNLAVYLLITLTFFSSIGWAQKYPPIKSHPPAPAYDIVFDQDGNLRPAYKDIFPVWKKMNKIDYENAVHKDFKGFYSLDALPAVIDKDIFDKKRAGEIQRATALKLFLQDYYSGKKTYIKAGVIPESVVQKIIRRTHEQGMEKYLTPDLISFPMGADVTFDSKGEPVVIEDNIGHVGGPGDMYQSTVSLFKWQPKYKEILNLPPPLEYYQDLVAQYRKEAVPANGAIVLYQLSPYDDAEEILLTEVYPKVGVEIITPHTRDRLVATPEGAFIKRYATGNLDRVGYVIMNQEHPSVDPTLPPIKDKLYQEEVTAQLDEENGTQTKSFTKQMKALAANLDPVTGFMQPGVYEQIDNLIKKESVIKGSSAHMMRNGVPGLMMAVLKKQVATNYMFGVDFVGDKEFYTYVEDIIRFYMKTEPIIHNLPTWRFSKLNSKGDLVLDKVVFERAFNDSKFRVFKVVDGRGSKGVYLGPKESAKSIAKVKKMILAAPDRYILQPFENLATKNKYLIDSRTVLQVFPDRIHVPNVSWGRSVSPDGDGKVNVSASGAVAPTYSSKMLRCNQVLVDDEP